MVERLRQTHDRVTITRHGQRAAAILSVTDLDALEETVDLLSDPGAVREITEARAAADRGEGLDAEAYDTAT